MQSDLADMKVDKTGSGNVDFIDKLAFRNLCDDFSCDVSRVLALRFSKAHCDVGCEIAVPRIARAFDRGPDRRNIRRFSEMRQAGNGLLYKFCNAGFQRNKFGDREG